MNNMDEQYGIVSKLDFSNLSIGAVPTNFNEVSVTNLLWTATGNTGTTNMEIIESNGVKILNCKTITNSKIYTQSLASYSFNDTLNFQVEINIMIPTIKTDNIFFNISNNSSARYSFNIKNTYIGGLTISNGATYKIVCNYQFVDNVSYNIVVTKIGNNYSVMINGLIVGNLNNSTFTSGFSGLMTYIVVGKSQQSTASTVSEFAGQLWNVNMSMGNFLKYQNSFTKYGNNLISRYNFDNLATDPTSSVFTFPVEAVIDSSLTWTLSNSTFSTDGNGWSINNQSFSSDINNLNTITFNMNNTNNHLNIDLVNFNNKYKLKYSSSTVENFTLTNGTDTISKEYASLSIHSLKIINDLDKVTVKIDSDTLEISKDSTVSNAVLFNEYTGKLNDLRVYDLPFYDDDAYQGSPIVDFQYPEIEVIDDIEELQVLDVGDYILTGFIEGYTDRPFLIYNKEKDYILYDGIEDYAVDGINEGYKNEFEIHDKVNGQKYDVYDHEMIKGYISGNVNIANCGNNINMKVYCYRNDNNRLVGIYDLDSLNNYNIPNLDVNSYYDIVFKENNRKLENISSSYRKPKSY